MWYVYLLRNPNQSFETVLGENLPEYTGKACLVYHEKFTSKKDAVRREKQIAVLPQRKKLALFKKK